MSPARSTTRSASLVRLGQVLAERRQAQGYRLVDLQRRTQVSGDTIRRLERGDLHDWPLWNTIDRLTQALDLPLSDWLVAAGILPPGWRVAPQPGRDFGVAWRNLRQESGYALREVALLLSYPRRHLRRVESGVVPPSPELFCAFAHLVLGLAPGVVLSRLGLVVGPPGEILAEEQVRGLPWPYLVFSQAVRPTPATALGAVIAQRRQQLGLSQAALERRLREPGRPTDHQQVAVIERGEVSWPAPDTLRQLAGALDTTVTQLLTAAGLLPAGVTAPGLTAAEFGQALGEWCHRQGLSLARLAALGGCQESHLQMIARQRTLPSPALLDRLAQRVAGCPVGQLLGELGVLRGSPDRLAQVAPMPWRYLLVPDAGAHLGATLARQRQNLGLTQEALSRAIAAPRDTIANLETGRSRWPRPQTLARLAATLQTTPAALFAEAGLLPPGLHLVPGKRLADLAAVLRAARAAAGRSRQTISQSTGRSVGTLQGLEGGRILPSWDLLRDYAAAVDRTVGDLLWQAGILSGPRSQAALVREIPPAYVLSEGGLQAPPAAGPSPLVLGPTLRQLRREAGWTQRQVGDCCGLAQAEVSHVEHGLYPPPAAFLALFAQHVTQGTVADLYVQAGLPGPAPDTAT